MEREKKTAKIAGFSLILMAVIAGFSFGFAFPKFYDKTQLEAAQKIFLENIALYKYMLAGIVLIIILDIIVAWALFQFFKNDSEQNAFLSFVFRIIYTIGLCIATYFLANNFTASGNTVFLNNYALFQKTWDIGLIVFGIHLLIIGYLMKMHGQIPKVLWYLTIIAGIAYVLVHTMKVFLPDLQKITETINNILALPMALGELGLAIWLIVKGGKRRSVRI